MHHEVFFIYSINHFWNVANFVILIVVFALKDFYEAIELI